MLGRAVGASTLRTLDNAPANPNICDTKTMNGTHASNLKLPASFELRIPKMPMLMMIAMNDATRLVKTHAEPKRGHCC